MCDVPSDVLAELHDPFTLTTEQVEQYEMDGFIVIKKVFSEKLLNYFKGVITPLVLQLNNLHKPMEDRTTYEKAFLQVINLWRHSDIVKEFVFSRRLGSIATQVKKSFISNREC